ncbi:Lipase B [Pseudocercospora fuligena]|uniref:Lipase B n=1 Tax=Pseudocercospora fuligena TaxID=685502 RepID=A0A8H6RDL0_9PEZI|nr:Lipase B [Pseudocercospora fuligena]
MPGMSPLEILVLLFSVHAIASPLVRRSAPVFDFDGDAPFTVDPNTLASSLTCPYGNPTSSSPPVLLVHGTATTGAESWGDGYVPALKADGYTACYVTIPNRSMGDMQINAEYVAYNLHYISTLSGGLQTAVIAHSQGNPNTQWALQFWPSTRNVTRAFVALSADFSGIDVLGSDTLFHDICESGVCQAALWQQAAGSEYYKALHAANFRAQVPTTSIWTQVDGVVAPFSENAQLPGATVLSVQSLCPLRPTTHVTMTISSATYALALDALDNGGIANLSRVKKNRFSICLRATAKGMRVSIASDLQKMLVELVNGFLLATPMLKSEPALAPYAQQ